MHIARNEAGGVVGAFPDDNMVVLFYKAQE